jgi:large subunit ribosomal protein L31e
MAKDDKKKKEEKKVVLERAYVVPLRKEWLKAPRWNRTKKAVKALKEFVKKHMKAVEVKLGKHINKELWKHGIKNPPHKVKVNCSKDDKGIVTAEMVGAPVEKPKEEPKKTVKKAVEGKVVEEKKDEKKETKTEAKTEVKKEAPKEEKKPEVKKEEAKPAPKVEEKPKTEEKKQ